MSKFKDGTIRDDAVRQDIGDGWELVAIGGFASVSIRSKVCDASGHPAVFIRIPGDVLTRIAVEGYRKIRIHNLEVATDDEICAKIFGGV